MALAQRVRNILLEPRAEWARIAGEPASVPSLYRDYILVLAAVGPVAGAVSRAPHDPVGSLGAAIVAYGVALAVTYVLALIVDALAPAFGGEKNLVRSLQLVAYSYTAVWVGAIFQIVPVLGGVVSLVAVVYAFYTFYLGVPALKQCPPGKAAGYTIVVALCAIAIAAVLAIMMISVLLGGGMMR
jgi:hypothetical protein